MTKENEEIIEQEEDIEINEQEESQKDEPVEEASKKEITIYDIPGVGAATADKLNDAGYND